MKNTVPPGDLVFADYRKDIDRTNFNPGITRDARLFTVASLISEGMSQAEIQTKLQSEWGVSYSFVQGIIQEALNTFKDNEIYKHIKEINNERLNQIYKESKQSGDTKNALKAIDLLNKSNGVYGDGAKVEVNTDESNIVITFGGQQINI